MTGGERAPALAGLRLLDLTHFLAGPYCTQLLADLGADVIKVESPAGDLSRTLPPHFVAGESAYYLAINRNKRSVVLDLKSDQGKRVLKRLARHADVVVESYRPGVLDRLGVGHDELSSENPQLVWCSITGFGQDGPYRDRPAYDMIVQAVSGAMSITGEAEGRPVRTGQPIGDLAAGMLAAIGILAALERRRASGRGEVVDISMLDAQVSMLSYLGVYHLVSGDVPGRQGRGHDSIPTYRAFTAGDGLDVVVTANTERMWRGLCDALGVGELADDPRFATNLERQRNREELWPLLADAFGARPAAEWVGALTEAGVPAAAVNDVQQALADPQVRAREMVREIQGDEASVRVLGNPIKLRDAGEPEQRFPPHLGEHTHAVLAELLGLGPAELAALAEAGAFGAGEVPG
jgi:CoA:oxalate CoA-transferase